MSLAIQTRSSRLQTVAAVSIEGVRRRRQQQQIYLYSMHSDRVQTPIFNVIQAKTSSLASSWRGSFPFICCCCFYPSLLLSLLSLPSPFDSFVICPCILTSTTVITQPLPHLLSSTDQFTQRRRISIQLLRLLSKRARTRKRLGHSHSPPLPSPLPPCPSVINQIPRTPSFPDNYGWLTLLALLYSIVLCQSKQASKSIIALSAHYLLSFCSENRPPQRPPLISPPPLLIIILFLSPELRSDLPYLVFRLCRCETLSFIRPSPIKCIAKVKEFAVKKASRLISLSLFINTNRYNSPSYLRLSLFQLFLSQLRPV